MLKAALLLAVFAGAAAANPLPAPNVSESLSLQTVSALAVPVSPRPKARRAWVVPEARWSNEGPKRRWTLTILSALRSHASVLPTQVPRDIDSWCPAYRSASFEAREGFWVGLVSSLAWHESTHRPTAVGGGGRWYGLTQIWPPTANHFKCRVQSGSALKDPEDNLSCAMRIMAYTVPRDGVISAGMRGVAADWGPFHSRRKREDMRAWVSSQDYCVGLSRSLRPVLRPASLGPEPTRPQGRPGGPPVIQAHSPDVPGSEDAG